jgi:hypothetical protein
MIENFKLFKPKIFTCVDTINKNPLIGYIEEIMTDNTILFDKIMELSYSHFPENSIIFKAICKELGRQKIMYYEYIIIKFITRMFDNLFLELNMNLNEFKNKLIIMLEHFINKVDLHDISVDQFTELGLKMFEFYTNSIKIIEMQNIMKDSFIIYGAVCYERSIILRSSNFIGCGKITCHLFKNMSKSDIIHQKQMNKDLISENDNNKLLDDTYNKYNAYDTLFHNEVELRSKKLDEINLKTIKINGEIIEIIISDYLINNVLEVYL